MAQTENTATNVTRDAADLLVEALNTSAGLAFVRDAWENKAPDDYGVVELDGAPVNMWADNTLIAQVFQLTVHVYTDGSRDDLVDTVQGILAANCDTYSLAAHEFLFDSGKNHWKWNCQIIGPIQ